MPPIYNKKLQSRIYPVVGQLGNIENLRERELSYEVQTIFTVQIDELCEKFQYTYHRDGKFY